MPGSEYYDCPCGCEKHRHDCTRTKAKNANPYSTYNCTTCGEERNGYENHYCPPARVCDRHRDTKLVTGTCSKCAKEMHESRIKVWSGYVEATNARIREVEKELARLRNLQKQQIQDLEDLKND
jgi:hypothetical protein